MVGDDDFTFGSTSIASGVPNPMTFTGSVWPVSFHVHACCGIILTLVQSCEEIETCEVQLRLHLPNTLLTFGWLAVQIPTMHRVHVNITNDDTPYLHLLMHANHVEPHVAVFY